VGLYSNHYYEPAAACSYLSYSCSYLSLSFLTPAATCLYTFLPLQLPVFILSYPCSFLSLYCFIPAATFLYPILFLQPPVFILSYSYSYLSLSYLIPAATCLYPILFLQLPLFILPCSFLSLSFLISYPCMVPIPFLAYSHLMAAANSPYPCHLIPAVKCSFLSHPQAMFPIILLLHPPLLIFRYSCLQVRNKIR
jgi:hypothetical protein